MQHITFVSTIHKAIGECNLFTMQHILEQIGPQVTFEEMPLSSKELNKGLEGLTISTYSNFHKIERVFVDNYAIPPESFFEDYKSVIEHMEQLEDINGLNFRQSSDKHKEHVRKYGFQYLNSIACININDEINNAIENGLLKLNNAKLLQAYQSWNDVNNNRENVMLQNIYKYSKEDRYERAIFTLGSGHRKSIMQKIEEFEAREELRLSWGLINFT